MQVEHFYLRTHEVDVTGNDVKPVYVGGIDGIAHVGMVDDALIERTIDILYIHSKSA